MRSLDDLAVAGRTVLVRADFNVPLADGPDGPGDSKVITDDGRITAALPTLNFRTSMSRWQMALTVRVTAR